MFYESQPGNQSHSLCFCFKARTSGAPEHTSGVPVFSELAEPRTDEVLWPLPSQGAYGLAAGQVTILGELVRNADPHALASLTAEEWRPVCRLKSLRNCSLTLVLGLQAQGRSLVLVLHLCKQTLQPPKPWFVTGLSKCSHYYLMLISPRYENLLVILGSVCV